MEDEIDAAAEAGAGFRVFDGALGEVDGVEAVEIGALAGDEVIDATDRSPLGEERAGDAGADEACDSGDQVGGHFPLSGAAFIQGLRTGRSASGAVRHISALLGFLARLGMTTWEQKRVGNNSNGKNKSKSNSEVRQAGSG